MGKSSPRPAARNRTSQRDRFNQPSSNRRLSRSGSIHPVQQPAAAPVGQVLRAIWAVGGFIWQLLWHLTWYAVRLSAKLLGGVIRLMRRYPALGLLTGWAILVGIAIAATTAILNPEASVDLKAASRIKPSEPSVLHQTQSPAAGPLPTAKIAPRAVSQAGRTPAIRPQPAASYSPAAAFSIILISCSAGCLFLSRCLQPRSGLSARRPDLTSRPRQQFSQPAALASTSPPLAAMSSPTTVQPEPDAPESAPDWAFELSLPAQLEAPVYHGPLLAADEIDSEPLDEEVVAEVDWTTAEPVDPAVVPETQDHPLDWTEPSLADSLDLRQRRPLSDWLGGVG